jgi:hypothetical protein
VVVEFDDGVAIVRHHDRSVPELQLSHAIAD